MSSDPSTPYGKQQIEESDLRAVAEALKEPFLTRGPKVAQFEKAVATYCGASYAVAFNSGSSALKAACFAAEAGPFDEVVTTPNTFIATAGAAVQFGAKLRLVDINRTTGSLAVEQLAPLVQRSRSRGKQLLLPVHFAGIPCDMKKIEKLVTNPKTVIIEDAAHALGSRYVDGQRVGSCAFSQMTVFSFHPLKTITTGEGGMVTTNDPKLDHRLRLFRDNGIERSVPCHYEVTALTGNYHLTDFQAALGISQLKRLDDFVDKRRQCVAAYREQLASIHHLTCLTDQYDKETAFHLMVVQIDFEACGTTREAAVQQLSEGGIGTQVHYIPLYRHPVFAAGFSPQSFPEMERYFRETLTLPLYVGLSIQDISRVVELLKKALTSSKREETKRS